MEYYEILGIKSSASQAEIRNAYKRKALYYHPDRNLNNVIEAERKFKEIANAYQILSNPKTREEYDNNTTPNTPITDNDPLEIFYQMFPLLRDPLVRQTLLGKISKHFRSIVDSSWNELFTAIIMNKYEQQCPPPTPVQETKQFNITIPITLLDHYTGNFDQDVSVTFDKDTTINLTVDTRIPFCQQNVTLPKQSAIPDITINIECKYEVDSVFTPLKQRGDILHTIHISVTDFLNGFSYTLPYFGQTLELYFSDPYQDNMGYVLEGYGIPYDDDYIGNLYLKLQINPSRHTNRTTMSQSSSNQTIHPLPLTFVVLETLSE